jgi:phosphocarrier protein FPr
MVTTVDQWRIAKELITVEQEKMEIDPVPLGLLIQAPAAAVSAAHFAREADYLVVDADDLAQFTLAIDRRHPHLASRLDALDPAVLHLINIAAQAAAAHNKPLTISGVIAADPQAIPILIGLGVTGLNTPPSAIPSVKAQINSLNAAECQSLAQQALAQESATQVRALS